MIGCELMVVDLMFVELWEFEYGGWKYEKYWGEFILIFV